MSRVGKMPITVPQGVDVKIAADQITVKGIMAKVDGGLSATTGNAQEVTMANGKRVLAGQADNEK